ncbi:hypothetical protein [Galbibacter pacificus]|uniref:Uncharacterized protein n=1 Tax=Galbibacter pacificus TaxID=2996052 RepID=A0ABT6FMM1_9FLAO|nr:hypothetical protein [Galbibacter pacificus]MDG3581025.1 hypothetical protein [Galbibacter pacificus]MDG3584503.1 hypothetical protein [Galbibacter pacificus]
MQLQNGTLEIVDGALYIKDGKKAQYLFLKIALLLSACIGVFHMYNYFRGDAHYSIYVIVMGIISAFILIWLFQYSNKEVISLGEIKKIKQKDKIVGKVFTIYLKSGQKRKLTFPKEATDIKQLLTFFKEKGFL